MLLTARAMTPSTTLQPSITPFLPTLTPKPAGIYLHNAPTPNPIRQYQLTEWTPDKADELINILENYPDTLSFEERGYIDSWYYYSYRYAALAQTEALFRFPETTHTQQWKWDRAYNKLQGYHTDYNDAGYLYAQLITEVLNNGKASVSDFISWFEGKDLRLNLDITPLPPISGYDSSQIISMRLRNQDITGAIYIWLLEQLGSFTAYPLISSMDIYLGDGTSSLNINDLNGDSIPEAIIQHIDWESFSIHDGSLEIYDLSQVPPQKLIFDLINQDMEIANWTIINQGERSIGISLKIPFQIESGGCGDFGSTWEYQWGGNELKLIKIELPTVDEMSNNPYCADLLINHLLHYARQNNQYAILAIINSLDHYPFSDADQTSNSYPKILEPDELRFSLGLILARDGYVTRAREQMQRIVSVSKSTTSPWVEPAHLFLSKFHLSPDLYEACLISGKCYPCLEINELVELIPLDRYADILSLLGQMGVPTTYSGTYDFDSDGTEEYWLLDYRWPDAYYHDIWVFSPSPERITSRAATQVRLENVIGEVEIFPIQSIMGLHAYKVIVGNDELEGGSFIYWEGGPVQPIPFKEAELRISNIINLLISGQITPSKAINDLLDLQDSPVECPYPSISSCLDNELIQYALGFAYEQQGYNNTAADIYLQLWKNYPESPYAIMAMYKLEPIP